MDELMKQAEDHLAKDRVQIATDEAFHGIKRDDRAQFEVWYRKEYLSHLPLDRNFPEYNESGDFYISESVEFSYMSWKAALSSNAAQSAGQEPVEIDLMTGDVLYVNSYRITPQEMPIGARIIKTWKIDPKELRAAIPDLFGSHLSSAAQVEEIRNAALEEGQEPVVTHEMIEAAWNVMPPTMDDMRDSDIRAMYIAMKTAAPSKGEE